MNNSHNRYKADLFNYETILAQEELPSTLHCLSATTKMLLLSVLDPIAWKTRYKGDADQEKIREWRDQAMVELILDSCGEDLCALITWAIENCDDVQGVLDVFAGEQGWSSGVGNPATVLPTSVLAENLLPEGYTCDQDHRYGMAVGLVEYLHGAVLEVMQLIENATNPLELAAEVGDNVPIWEIAATGADVILWIQETMYDAYVGAWSDVVKDELACQLHCQMELTGSCLISLDTLWAVYNDNDFAGAPSLGDPLIDWMVWLYNLPLEVSILIVKTATLMPLLALRYGGMFGSIAMGVRSLETTIALLEDETNSDWDILCDTCPELHLCVIDFALTDGGFVQRLSSSGFLMGVWEDQVGWVGSLSDEAGGYLHFGSFVELSLTGTARVGKLTLNFSLTKGYTVNENNNALYLMRFNQNNFVRITSALEDGDEQDWETNDTYYTGVEKLVIGLRTAWYPPPPPDRANGMSILHRLTIEIEGDVPTELLPYVVY